jgi:hypothetical protein
MAVVLYRMRRADLNNEVVGRNLRTFNPLGADETRVTLVRAAGSAC